MSSAASWPGGGGSGRPRASDRRRQAPPAPAPATPHLLPACLILLSLLAAGRCPAAGWTDFEEALGQLALQDFELRNGLVKDRLLQDWVDRVATPVAAQSTRRLTFRFHILGSYENNAFSLPGGHICVTRGLLSHVTSDEELAGVLAHEVGHTEDRDFQRMLKQQLLYLAAQGILREHVGRNWIYATQIVQLLDGLRVQRRHEAEADLKGVELALAARYDPRGVATFLQQLPDGKGLGGALLATHPQASRRLQAVRQHIAQLEAPDYDATIAVADSLRDRLHYRSATQAYERAAQQQPGRPEAPARLADMRRRRGLPEQGAVTELALTPEQRAHVVATLGELRRREQELYQAETKLRKGLQAYQKDRDIAWALQVSQAISPEINDVQYLAALAHAYYALAASWNAAVRLGEIVSRSVAVRTGWERSATDLQARHKVTGGAAANEAEWQLATAQFDAAVPAVVAATVAVRRAAGVSGELSRATRLLAVAFLALVSSGPDQPLGRLNFTRFLLLQGDVLAAERRLHRVAKTGQEAHAEIVRRHVEALGEQMSILHATGRPALRDLDCRLIARRLDDGLAAPAPTPQTLSAPLLARYAPPQATVESLQALDTILRMCYLDMRAERGE